MSISLTSTLTILTYLHLFEHLKKGIKENISSRFSSSGWLTESREMRKSKYLI